MQDLSVSSAIVILAVLAVVALYYQWSRSVLLIMPPLLLGALYTFALASLPPFRVTELNSNTAFLGSIIVGNGINFGIILVARYVEERRSGLAVEPALEVAVSGARPGTVAAALAAGVAYASLAVTDFRGFRQFGYIGGLGMLACWLLAFLLTPSLAARFDRGGHGPKPVGARRLPMAFIATRVSTRPRPFVVAAPLLTVLALNEVPQALRIRCREGSWLPRAPADPVACGQLAAPIAPDPVAQRQLAAPRGADAVCGGQLAAPGRPREPATYLPAAFSATTGAGASGWGPPTGGLAGAPRPPRPL